jgi:hypothetical protein
MILSTIVTLAILTAPQEISISKSLTTPDSVASFNGVVVQIDKESVRAIDETSTVVITDFPLGVDGDVDLRLQRFEIFTEDANVVIGSTDTFGKIVNTYAPRPNLVLLRGTIERDPTSKVFLAFGEHTTNGLIETEGKTYVLANDKVNNLNVVYNLRDVDPELMNWVDFHCDVEDQAQPIRKKGNSGQNRSVSSGCQTIQVAIETDWEFTGDLFDGNTAESSEYATTLLAAVSSIFNADVGYALQVSYLRLWEDESDPWTGSSTSTQLGQFRSYWLSNMTHIDRHLAHFLSGRSLGGGKAYIGAVCTSYGFAVSANLRGSFPIPVVDHSYNNWDIYVVAHETGHNVGTRHTHDYSPPVDNCGNGDCTDAWGGTIMSYCHQCSGGTSNIVLSFAPRVQETIEAYLLNVQSDECVLDCNANIPGACCVEEVCSEVTSGDCVTSGGVFLGSATTCATFSCVEQFGACCVSGTSCQDTDSLSCVAVGGIFLGDGSDCLGGGCDSDAQYACCFEDTCVEMSQIACSNAAGDWNGIGASCASGACDPLSNDFCETARLVTAGSWAFTTVGALSSDEPPDNELCDEAYLGGAHADVWFRYEACDTGNLLVSTCESVDFDSDLVVYEGGCSSLVQVGCNGDGAGCGGFTSELNVLVEEGSTYYIRVGGFSSNSFGNGQLVIGGLEQDCDPDSPCIGDLDFNGEIDVNDLLILLNHWGEAIPEYDFDEDGYVSIGDVLLVFANWGACE